MSCRLSSLPPDLIQSPLPKKTVTVGIRCAGRHLFSGNPLVDLFPLNSKIGRNLIYGESSILSTGSLSNPGGLSNGPALGIVSSSDTKGAFKPQVDPGGLVLNLFHPCHGFPTLIPFVSGFSPAPTIRRTSVKCQYFQEKLLDPGAADRRQGEEGGPAGVRP